MGHWLMIGLPHLGLEAYTFTTQSLHHKEGTKEMWMFTIQEKDAIKPCLHEQFLPLWSGLLFTRQWHAVPVKTVTTLPLEEQQQWQLAKLFWCVSDLPSYIAIYWSSMHSTAHYTVIWFIVLWLTLWIQQSIFTDLMLLWPLFTVYRHINLIFHRVYSVLPPAAKARQMAEFLSGWCCNFLSSLTPKLHHATLDPHWHTSYSTSTLEQSGWQWVTKISTRYKPRKYHFAATQHPPIPPKDRLTA